MYRPEKSHRGFTLLEVLVALTVTSLILIGALTALENTSRITRRGMSLSQAQQTASYSMQELANGVRVAGFMVGKANAIVGSASMDVVRATAWDNFDPANPAHMAGAWAYPATAKTYQPVTGTDGVTVRFSNGQPPIHVCAMPSGNSPRLELAFNPAYSDAYPNASNVPMTVDLFTTNTCPGSNTPGTTGQINSYPITITQVVTPTPPGQCSCTGGNCQASTSSCVAVDPLCADLYNNSRVSCLHIQQNNTTGGCNFCQVGPTYMLVSISRSFWISTEDGTGVIYDAAGNMKSRPVLVSRDGYSNQARIIATDVEDLQVDYLMDPTDLGTTAIGAVGVNGQMPQLIPNPYLNVLPTTATQATYVNAFAAVRAMRLNLTARTPAIDLTYRNRSYCAANMPALQPLVSRPGLSNHPSALVGDTDFCDGYRRHVVTQTVFLSNMLAKGL